MKRLISLKTGKTLFLWGFLLTCFTALLPPDARSAANNDSYTPPPQHRKLFNENVTIDTFPGWINSFLNSLEWKKHKRPNELTSEILQKSFVLGRRFMLNNQKPEGNFNYQYDFVKKKMDTSDNQVRQAGALWGLSLMYRYDPDPKNKIALEKALKFFFDHTKKGAVDGTLVIAYPGESTCKTGTVALVALAIIEYLRTEKDGNVQLPVSYKKDLTDRLNGYIRHLQHMILPNKLFSMSYDLKNKKKSSRSSPYFDGEAILCLVKAAKYLGYTRLIPLIETSSIVMAKTYTIDQWKTDPDSKLTKGFFQWSCMAFWEYHDAGWKNATAFGDYVLSLSWWMIHTHKTLKRTRNTAYAYEGIIHGYRIAKTGNHQAAVHDLAYTIDKGLMKLTSWQVGGPLQSRNRFLTSNPTADSLAIGGIMNHKRKPPLRIDVTQHQMHSVILAIKYVY